LEKIRSLPGHSLERNQPFPPLLPLKKAQMKQKNKLLDFGEDSLTASPLLLHLLQVVSQSALYEIIPGHRMQQIRTVVTTSTLPEIDCMDDLLLLLAMMTNLQI
jgi:hypothetical protein